MSTSRREFLRQTAAWAALSALPLSSASAAAPAAPRARLSLGHSLYGMPGVPLAEALGHCARIGFRNVELLLDPGSPSAPSALDRAARDDLRRRLDGLGLGVSGLMRNIRLIGGLSPAENLAAIREAGGLAHDLGFSGDTRPPIETVLGGKPEDWAGAKHEMAGRLGEWAAAAGAAGVAITVKAHMSNAVDTPEKLLWLLDQVASPHLHATYDYSHFEANGLALEPTWRALAARTRFVHLKDSGQRDGKFTFLLPGEGRVDYVKLFRLMDESGYRGPVVSEISAMIFRQPGYDAVAAAEHCHRVLVRALEESGVAHA